MRRNLANELIVALLAAVSLVFAAVFAVLLSTSTSQRPTEAPTEPAVASFDIYHHRHAYRKQRGPADIALRYCCNPYAEDLADGGSRIHSSANLTP